MVYDRGGGVKRTIDRLAKEGVRQVGMQPKGKVAWRVAGAVREQVRSERGKTEGVIGTLKSNAYKESDQKEEEKEAKQVEDGGKRIELLSLERVLRHALVSLLR